MKKLGLTIVKVAVSVAILFVLFGRVDMAVFRQTVSSISPGLRIAG